MKTQCFLCLCLLWEVWEGTSEGLFLPLIVICVESLQVESLRCCFYTCTRLSSNMPFPLSAVEIIPTSQHVCLLSSGVCIAWAHHSLVGGNRQNILEPLFIAVSSGGYNCCKPQNFTKRCLQPQKSTLVTATGFHGLHVIVGFAFIIILFLIPTKMSLYFLIIILSLMFFGSIMNFPIYLHLLVRVLY